MVHASSQYTLSIIYTLLFGLSLTTRLVSADQCTSREFDKYLFDFCKIYTRDEKSGTISNFGAVGSADIPESNSFEPSSDDLSDDSMLANAQQQPTYPINIVNPRVIGPLPPPSQSPVAQLPRAIMANSPNWARFRRTDPIEVRQQQQRQETARVETRTLRDSPSGRAGRRAMRDRLAKRHALAERIAGGQCCKNYCDIPKETLKDLC